MNVWAHRKTVVTIELTEAEAKSLRNELSELIRVGALSQHAILLRKELVELMGTEQKPLLF